VLSRMSKSFEYELFDGSLSERDGLSVMDKTDIASLRKRLAERKEDPSAPRLSAKVAALFTSIWRPDNR